jgi:hypothetical protein
VARRRRQRIDVANARAIGLLLLAGCVHGAPADTGGDIGVSSA